MLKSYRLKNAILQNSTGIKYDAIASPASYEELIDNANNFDFNFKDLIGNYLVYKLVLSDEPLIIQGLVAFKPSIGILECANMEIAQHNKHGYASYNGIGKAMVAVCCKFSWDNGMDGYIAFDAKSRLINYYSRMGAFQVSGIRMAIDTQAALKLLKLYF